jgi:hypothetical protein
MAGPHAIFITFLNSKECAIEKGCEAGAWMVAGLICGKDSSVFFVHQISQGKWGDRD